MAYNKVVIDVEARFIDELSDDAKAASKSMDNLGKEAQEAAKEVDKLGKKKVKPKVDADTSSVTKKVSKIDRMLAKLGRSKTDIKLSALDRATAKIERVKEKLKTLTWKSHNILLKTQNSDALRTLNNMSGKIKSITGKTWSAAIKIKDTFTKPLSMLKNSLFNIRTLIAGIASAWAAVKFVKEPIALADAYSSAKIGFSTLLGESQGQQMMNDLDAFAKATPFKSSQVIQQTQRMLAMGWDAESIIDDMGTIGDAAAATGKGEQGLQQIVTALAQIKTKGRLSTEELNQLAEAGISAKKYLAEGLGYGSGDKGIAKMTKDLEDGAIASGKALEALLSGMKEYQGMMDQTANETVSGLWSQIEDTFEINIARRWGQGLQDGAKDAFGSIVTLIDEADGALTKFGDTVYDVGKKISTWAADKLKNTVERITEITGSYEFKNASLGGKISMLWNGVVADPLREWWEGGGREKTAETAGKIGSWMGEMLTKGLLALFGATDILDEGIGTDAGSSIAGSFLEGFLDNFDGSAITQAFVDAVGNVWGALPWWAKMLLGGYGIGKAAGGIANFAGGVLNFAGGVKNVVGGFNIASSAFPILTSSGSGLLGLAGKAGVGLGASTAGSAMLMGGFGIAGGLAGGASLIKGGMDLYGSYKAYKAGDKIEGKAKEVSGTTALTGVAGGAAIGALFGGPLGALIGAGIGGVAGWFMGGKAADDIRAAAYETETMKEAVEDADASAEELAASFEKAKWESAKEHFGDIKLSMAEIQRISDQIVWGEDLGYFEKFTSATKSAESSLESLKAASDTMDRWMWKAGLGVKFNDDEIESIKASADEYVSTAQSYLENKHYEFTASAELLLNLESKEGKAIIESGNAFYAAEQEKLNKAGEELGNALTEALKDGIISADEEKVIIEAQKKIAEITNRIANAESEAEIEVIKVKWGDGNLDIDSFDTFMSTMQTNLQSRMETTDKALEVQIANLKLRYPDGGEKFEKELQTIIEGYKAEVESIKADVLGVELNIIGEAYKEELGADAAADLNKVLQYAVENNIDPVEIPSDKLFELLGTELSPETEGNIRDMLSGVFEQVKLIEVDGKLLVDLGIEVEGDTTEKVESEVDKRIPEEMDDVITINLTAFKNIENNIDILANEFGIPESKAETILWELSGTKTIAAKVSYLAKEFGISETEAETILWKLSGQKSIMNKFSLYASDFGIKSSYTFSPTVSINPTWSNSTASVAQKLLSGGGFRGGIFGGSSNLKSFARGGIAGYFDGGIVRGGSQLIEVAEEGSPEMVIPLSDQRRDRGLKLWEKAGEMLKAPGFFRGGRTDSGADEGIRFRGYDSGGASGGQSIQVSVAGISIEIHVNSDGSTNIVEAIKAHTGEIADAVVGEIAAQLGEIFENTPVRGGAA